MTYNRFDNLKKTIESLSQTVSMSQSKIVLVDDCSTDGNKGKLLEALSTKMRVVRNSTNEGTWRNWIKTADAVYKMATRKWFVVAQDDIIYSEHWVDETQRIIDRLNENGVDWGVLSLINFNREKCTADYYIMPANENRHSGAQCLVVNIRMWRQFVQSDEYKNQPHTNCCDHRIASYCRHNERSQWAVVHVGKSLVKHFGNKSTLHDRDMGDFVGVAYVEDK